MKQTIHVDLDTCTACGLCAADCSVQALVSDPQGAPTLSRPEDCEDCGHCVAVCPTGALSLSTLDAAAFRPVDRARLPDADTMQLALSSQRSCRHFRDRPVDRATIERLVATAQMAPSAKNSQEREYIVVRDPAVLDALRRDVAASIPGYTRLVGWLIGPLLSWMLSDGARHALGRMHRSFLATLRRLDRGEDRIFYGAPAVVFVCAPAKDSFGAHNAVLAQQYIALQAQAMGLGSCIMGYALAAKKALKRHLPVPPEYQVYGALALGYPSVRHRRTVARKPAPVHWVGEAEEAEARLQRAG